MKLSSQWDRPFSTNDQTVRYTLICDRRAVLHMRQGWTGACGASSPLGLSFPEIFSVFGGIGIGQLTAEPDRTADF